jgi:hypothetical protein
MRIVLFSFYIISTVARAAGNDCKSILTNSSIMKVAQYLDYLTGTATLPSWTVSGTTSVDDNAAKMMTISERLGLEVAEVAGKVPGYPPVAGNYLEGDTKAEIDAKKIVKELLRMMSILKAHNLVRHTKSFRFRHTHPFGSITSAFFSKPDLVLFFQIKALMEILGFSDQDLEAEIIYRDNKTNLLSIKTAIFPAAKKFSNKDYKVGGDMRLAIEKLSLMKPEQALAMMMDIASQWPSGTIENPN